MDREHFSKELRRLRIAKNWTMRDLEKHSGVSSAQISNFENGKRIPRSDTISKLAEALSVDVDILQEKPQNLYDYLLDKIDRTLSIYEIKNKKLDLEIHDTNHLRKHALKFIEEYKEFSYEDYLETYSESLSYSDFKEVIWQQVNHELSILEELSSTSSADDVEAATDALINVIDSKFTRRFETLLYHTLKELRTIDDELDVQFFQSEIEPILDNAVDEIIDRCKNYKTWVKINK